MKNNPFAKLGGAVDQKLYQDTIPKPTEKANENASKLASQQSGKPAFQQTSKPEIQHPGIPANQQTGNTRVATNTTSTEKVTYQFHSEGKYAVEDMKTILSRKHGIKASLEEIAEESILLAYEDLLANQQTSKLANRLARTPENKKSS
jgi:hypothetical protein